MRIFKFEVPKIKKKKTRSIFKILSLSKKKKKKITFHYVGQTGPIKFDNMYIRFKISDRISKGHLSFSLVQFSHSVVLDSLQPYGLQNASPPCPSPTPRACSNSCPSSQWCHPNISSSVVPSPPVFNLFQH